MLAIGINNSDDAINFFARYGSETPVKFVNLIQNPDPRVFSPYELIVSDLKDVPPEGYYTMSSAGIVFICPHEPSECTPLSAFMRQGMMFKILRTIPFYKLYLHRKAFTVWKENIRYLLFTKQRKKLVDRLFYARKNSCSTIVSARKCLAKVQSVRILNLDLKTSNKDVFYEHQTTQTTKANSEFDSAMNLMQIEVQSLVTEVNNLYLTTRSDHNANALAFSDAAVEKAKSLVKMKQEKAEKKVIRQRAKLEHSTLPEFIRFVDYLSVEFLVSLAVGTSTAFNEELSRHDKRKNGVFETLVNFSSTGTVFSPTSDEIREMLERLCDNMINACGNVNRVIYLNNTRSNNSASSANGPNIQAIIRENKAYSFALKQIKDRVVLDFNDAEKYSEVYDKVRPFHDEFITLWDLESFKESHTDSTSLKIVMEKVELWAVELNRLRNKMIGLLELDSKRLQLREMSEKEARTHELREYIKELARLRCAVLLEHFKDALSKLSIKPTYLKEFAAQVSLIAKMRDEEKNLFKTTAQVDQMYNLLGKDNRDTARDIPPEDLVLHEDLHELQQEYRREIERAIVYRDEKMREMQTNVETNIDKLQEQVRNQVTRLDDRMFVEIDSFADPEKVLDEISQLGMRLESFDLLAKTYAGYQTLFNTPVIQQKELETGKEKYETLKSLWECIQLWTEKYKFYQESPFTDLNVEDVDKEVQGFYKDSFSLHKKLSSKVSEMLKDKIAEFKGMMSNILDLGNPKMKARHFEKIFRLINETYYNDMPFSLAFLLKGGIMNYKDAVQEISAAASGEAQLEATLDKIKSDWEKQSFTVINHRDQHGLFILGSLEEIFVLLEDHQVSLQTMLGSRYIRGVQDRVEEWAKKLSLLSETLDEWVTCQRTWMYLENIFGAEDIQKQLPAESQKFLVVDRSWKVIMTRTNNDSKVLSALIPLENGASLRDTFLMNNEALESIQKSLEEYLETKRMAFPRFYFLSNDELLEIMSQTRDPHAVQPHMSKCFDAIKRIKFGDGRHAHDIIGFLDPSDEYVPLSESVRAEGAVESWLLSFEKGMRLTLYDRCKHAFFNYPKTDYEAINRKEWLWRYPAQVVIAIDQVLWTFNCTKALRDMDPSYGGNTETGEESVNPRAMAQFLTFSLKQIDAMVDLVRAPLDKQQRTLLGALLTIDVHARDVVRAMVAKNVQSLSEFEWTKQLRYYWLEQEDDVFAKQTNSSFRYGYEYLGNGPRLVITPLTDTCYMTLTGALHMRLGGAPAGKPFLS